MKRMIRTLTSIITLAVVMPGPSSFAEHTIDGVQTTTKRLVSNKHDWTITFRTSEPTTARIYIYDPDMNIVRQLNDDTFKAEHSFTWDGTDARGEPVPTQVYIYRIRTKDKEGVVHAVDPYLQTAAQDTLSYWGKWKQEDGKIQFNLERDALARVRVGIENGPMIATPAEWVPLEKGEPRIAWDGKDDDGVKDYSSEKNIHVHTDAISLPDNYIQVINPQSDDPKSYLQTRWVRDAVTFNEEIQPKKYRTAQSVVEKTKEKGLLKILTNTPKDSRGILHANQPEVLTISFPKVPQSEREGQLYEVQYFIDGAYQSEDTLQEGDTIYEIDPENQTPGQHVLIVNALLGAGRIGTASLKYEINK